MSCQVVNTEPGMWPASHSLSSRTSRIWIGSPASVRSCSCSTVWRSMRFGRPLLLAPAGHAAVQEAAELADPDRDGETAGVAAVFVVAADEHDLLVAVGEPREL